MRWPPWRRRAHTTEQPIDPLLAAAEETAAQLEERADRVAPALGGRMRRNHWGETVQATARQIIQREGMS